MIFHDNKYTRWYNSLILKAKVRADALDVSETHHIIPQCIGGANVKENRIELSPREHFIAHLLLCKMHDSPKLIYAYHMMCHCNNPWQNRTYQTANSYELCKRLLSAETKRRMAGTLGSNLGRRMITDGVQSRYIKNSDTPPEGWFYGSGSNRREGALGANKGRVYYHDPVTLTVVALKNGEPIPAGYIKGNPNASINQDKRNAGAKTYHNSAGKEIRTKNDPGAGWFRGSATIWITDGMNDIRLDRYADIPAGMNRGRLNMKRSSAPRDTSYITDEFRKRISEKNREIQARPGYVNHNVGFIWYHDPHTKKNYHFISSDVVPPNLTKGMYKPKLQKRKSNDNLKNNC